MKVLQINIFGNLSTGRIAVDIYKMLVSKEHQGVIAFARNDVPYDVPCIKIGNKFDVYTDGILTRLTDKAGFYSKCATKKLIKEIQSYNPDIIHLHNLHGYYINIEILFDFLRQYQKPVVWTLHDCWSFTGHCCYYSMANCYKWINGCYDCQQKKAYPRSLFIDNSRENYKRKKELFTSLPNLQLVTVSKWLENEVKRSFLKNIPCTTIYNGIDLNVFRPTESDFKKRYGIENKIVILGVASTWDTRKGLADFIKLSALLDDKYKIVLIGLNKNEINKLPKLILGIERTNSIKELAEIYTAADIYLNASVEESFGLTTVEAMACGTPVIVYDKTALPEVINDGNGYVVKAHDLDTVVKILDDGIHRIDHSVAYMYNKDICYKEYMKLYEAMISK